MCVGALLASAPANACESSPGHGGTICGLDLESMLMMVQSPRANLLDEQVKSQIEELAIAKSHYESASAKFMALPVDRRTPDLVRALDVLDSEYQMARIRLTSLMNKRGESFELMTNFIKKFNADRATIIGNMR
jgi:chemotaxis protein CheY-P-specific phosphatase CheC